MVAKIFLTFCASAIFFQAVYAQCGNNYNAGLNNYNLGLNNGLNLGNNLGLGCYGASPAISASGGCLTVSSTSPIAPTGITVISENAIEGVLEVVGSLPVLAAVAVEGNLPSGGSAGTAYSCGNGNVGISGESLAAAGLGNGLANAGLQGIVPGAGNAGLQGINYANAGLAGANVGGLNGIRGGCGVY